MSGWIGAWGNAATVTNLTVTGSQVISVNTSTDALRITQTGTGNALKVEDSANPDATPFIIDSNGNVGIGTTPIAGRHFTVGSNITGNATSLAIFANGQVQSDVTSSVRYFQSSANTSAANFTSSEILHFYANQGTFGLGSTVSNQMGFSVANTLIGATNNYGFYSNIPSGANRYNFYASGTADNYFSGNTYTASGTTSMTSGFFYIPSAAGAPTGVPTAIAGRVPMYYDTTNNNFYVYNGTWKKVLLG